MKCQIKWIDSNGNDTPDENDAMNRAHSQGSTKALSRSGNLESHVYWLGRES
jgi:hypothetical protein